MIYACARYSSCWPTRRSTSAAWLDITSGGLLNLLRLEADVGFRIDAPLARPGIVELIARLGDVGDAELHEVFNCGCGFCVVVAERSAAAAVERLSSNHPGAARIGEVTTREGVVELPRSGLVGLGDGFRPA